MTSKSTPTIGDLFHRFALEAPVRTSDGAGGASLTYALAAEVWGSLNATGGTESPTPTGWRAVSPTPSGFATATA